MATERRGTIYRAPCRGARRPRPFRGFPVLVESSEGEGLAGFEVNTRTLPALAVAARKEHGVHPTVHGGNASRLKLVSPRELSVSIKREHINLMRVALASLAVAWTSRRSEARSGQPW